MVFIFLDLPKSYKYSGAKNAVRRSISAYDVNRVNYDVTDAKGYLGTGLTVNQSGRARSKVSAAWIN